MRKFIITLTLLLGYIGSAHAFLDSIADKAKGSGLMDMVSEKLDTKSSPLSNLVSSKLPVSTEQAVGGTGALLSLAQSQLSSENSREFQSLIPEMGYLQGAGNLIGQVDNINKVQSTFDKLGLDPSMISQFVPVILGYLGSQGASDGLLNSLSGVWGAEN